MRSRITTAAQWLVAAVLIAAAWWLSQHTPSMWMASAPIAERAELADRAEGRNIALTISGLRGADQLQVPATDGTEWDISAGESAESGAADDRILAGGHWLVVDLEAELTEAEPGGLVFAELVLGDTRYRASERVDSLLEHPLKVAASTTGSLAFELPADAREMGPAELQLGLNFSPDMDTLITLEIQPEDIDGAETAELLPVDWAEPVSPDADQEAS